MDNQNSRCVDGAGGSWVLGDGASAASDGGRGRARKESVRVDDHLVGVLGELAFELDVPDEERNALLLHET